MPIQPKQQPPYYEPGSANVLIYKTQFWQESDNTLHTSDLKNTLTTSNWTRTVEGGYQLQTQLTDITKLYIPGGSGWDDVGTNATPLLGGSNTIAAYMILSWVISSNLIKLTMTIKDTAGVSQDLYEIIGASKLWLPTIEYFN